MRIWKVAFGYNLLNVYALDQ